MSEPRSSPGGLEELLRACGVDAQTLRPAEKSALDRDGYVVLPGLVDAAWLERLRAAFEAQGLPAGPSEGARSGTRHFDCLASTSDAFHGVVAHPRVLAAAHHVLRRAFGVLLLGGRDPLPGFGQQGLHNDWRPRAGAEPFSVVTALWLLDDFTAENGATRLVPGSHLVPKPLPKTMQAPLSRHPDERLVLAPAGAALVFNGHLWHGGTSNRSTGPRRVLQLQLVARDAMPPPEARPALAARLAPSARVLLGW